MKKRVLVFLLCGILACQAAACSNGKESDTQQGTETLRSGQIGIDPKEQVTTLCDYEGIPMSIDSGYEVTDESVESNIQALLVSLGIGYKEVTDRKIVQAGDYVNVDFTGYHDGEAFGGGAAKDVLIDVDNNSEVTTGTIYIEGFSDGLLGAEVGSTVSSDVRFPDEYPPSPDLAGQMTTFEFVINSIYSPEEISLEELTDDFVDAHLGQTYGINTKEELLDAVKGSLETNLNSAKVEEAKAYMLENCVVEIPEDYLNARVAEYQESCVKLYCAEGETLDDFLKKYYKGTKEEFDDDCRKTLEEQIKVELIFGVIAEKENIEVQEEEFESYVQYFVQNVNYNFADEAAVYEYFGAGSVEEGEAYLRQLFAVNKAIDFVTEHAQVTFEKQKS